MAYFSVTQSEHGSPRLDAASSGPDSPTYQPMMNPMDQSIDGRVRQRGEDSIPSHISQKIGLGFAPDVVSHGRQPYAILEDDDEDDEPPPPPLHLHTPSVGSAPTSDQPPYGEQIPVRTASVSKNLPLKHPTPDLQSLQGAYLKNVERLEESAERLSITSSLVAEIEKMKQEQKNAERQSQSRFVEHVDTSPIRKFSSTSASNSIIGVNQTARHGGYSPAAYIASPTGSMRGSFKHSHHERRPSKAGPVSQPLEESEHEDRNSVEDETNGESSETLESQVEPLMNSTQPEGIPEDEEQQTLDRPGTSNSDDTCRQANTLFNDFDGVHYSASLRSSIDREGSLRQISINRPPLARDSKAFREAQPGEHMIYYPAPVPVMLNLPQRISKANFGEQERRRLKGLTAIPADLRQAAPWLDKGGSNDMQGKRATNLPPQLRAQAFFEQPGLSPNLQLKDGSAVATLDSLLDAAAFAPVSAFVDHPIVGQLGKEVYGSETSPKKAAPKKSIEVKKRRMSFADRLKPKRSSGALSTLKTGRISSRESKALETTEAVSGDELDEVAADRLAPGEDEIVGTSDTDERINAAVSEPVAAAVEIGEDEAEEDELHQQGFNSAPTTLLAELQMRKARQKLRNRTAADAFPNGMHSTLLELDAVTQLQQKSRKQKHITLAWEDQEAADRQNFDDEEVPLGVLFPEKDRAEQYNAHRPIGLLEKREIEDNEPLSHRRARLRGEPIQQIPVEVAVAVEPTNLDDTTYKVDIPGLADINLPEEEEEEETLAQRAKRMKEQKEKAVSSEFAADVSSELGLGPIMSDKTPSRTPDVEETLGERRKRLKEEAARNISGGSSEINLNAPAKPRYNMANLLHAHPTGLRQIPNEHGTSAHSRLNPQAHFNNGFGAQSVSGFQYPQTTMHQQPMQYFQSQPTLIQMPARPGMMPAPLGYQYPYQTPAPQYGALPMMEQPLDPRQRAVIDQWRLGIF